MELPYAGKEIEPAVDEPAVVPDGLILAVGLEIEHWLVRNAENEKADVRELALQLIDNYGLGIATPPQVVVLESSRNMSSTAATFFKWSLIAGFFALFTFMILGPYIPAL